MHKKRHVLGAQNEVEDKCIQVLRVQVLKKVFFCHTSENSCREKVHSARDFCGIFVMVQVLVNKQSERVDFVFRLQMFSSRITRDFQIID